MLSITKLLLDHYPCGTDPRSRMSETSAPVVSWTARSTEKDVCQKAFRLRAGTNDFGWIESGMQSFRLPEGTLAEGKTTVLSLEIEDTAGEFSAPYSMAVWNAAAAWEAPWIGDPAHDRSEALYFRKVFTLTECPAAARLYTAGIGYCEITVNGMPVNDGRLDPAHSDYSKTVYYVYTPDIRPLLREGENVIEAITAPGWRDNVRMHDNDWIPKVFPFDGPMELSVMLVAENESGEAFRVMTDGTWEAGTGPIAQAGLFDGEVWDMGREKLADAHPAAILPAPGGRMRPMIIPPIREKRVFAPMTSWWDGEGYVMDFGQNIAGVLRVPLRNMKKGQVLRLAHTEELDEKGRLFRDTLRFVRAEDTYIAAGDGTDPEYWQPRFTYHGFRYARIEGLTGVMPEEVRAVELHSDVENRSFFRCGSPIVTRIHEICTATERANIHSILTDCPQRDERLGWMNDATVRFEETPYNFTIGALFPKVVRDLVDSADENGAISNTAPRATGSDPADPVCSSFLIAAWESLLHTGNLDIIEEAYGAMAAWEDYLIAHGDRYEPDFGGLGDWASPADCCGPRSDGTPGTNSAITPSAFMSTGYSYLNSKLLAKFARALGREDEAGRRENDAAAIRQAILDKWYDPETGSFAGGSEGSLSFALWLGIAPEPEMTALRLHEAVVKAGMRLTTGNLCSRYILDALTDNGYVEDAWTLMTREEYPSIGYELQQEATTVWERFELSTDPAMNSHSHPMYGSCDRWMYTALAGLEPISFGWKTFRVKPAFPAKLLSTEAMVETEAGDVTVHWARRYGGIQLQVDVPFGTSCEVVLPNGTETVGSGWHTFFVPTDRTNILPNSGM